MGSRRKPEAVIISYEQYLETTERLADQELDGIAQARLARSVRGTDVDLDQVAAELGLPASGAHVQ